LADAMSYVEKNYSPSRIIDYATLTGACLVIFGEFVAAIISTDDKIAKDLFDAGERTYERVWKLPLYEEYVEEIKGEISDLKTLGYGKYAGTLIGAAFLKQFVEKTPWVHFDIAGTGWYDKDRHYINKGATGYGVRLMIEYFKNK